MALDIFARAVINKISKYMWQFLYWKHDYLIRHACAFYSFKLRHPRQITKRGHSLGTLLSRCVTNFRCFNRRIFIQRIRQRVWFSCRNCGRISPMRSRNIALFRNIIYVLPNKGTCDFDVRRWFRQIFWLRSKSDICEKYIYISRFMSLLKWCVLRYG